MASDNIRGDVRRKLNRLVRLVRNHESKLNSSITREDAVRYPKEIRELKEDILEQVG